MAATLGAALRRLRKAQGLTLQQLASRCGLSQPFLSQLENGKAMPSLMALHNVAQALATTAHSLLQPQERLEVSLVRHGEGETYQLVKGASVRFLTRGGSHLMEPNEVAFEPGAGTVNAGHEGEEVIYVLEGCLRVELEGSESVEVAVGDLRDRDSLGRAMKGREALFHTAALYSLWSPNPGDFVRTNVEGTTNILEAAMEAEVERVVYTSTASVFGHWKGGLIPDEKTLSSLDEIVDGYHRSKFIAEERALEFCSRGLDLVIVNPTAPIGPWDPKPTPTGRIVLDFIKGRMPAYIDTGINIADVRDVARGHILAYEKGRTGERYILGNHNLTLKELLEALARVTGMSAPRVRLPYGLAMTLAHVEHLLSVKLLSKQPRIPVAGVRMARHPMYFDSSKAVSELGMPQTPIETALRDAVTWFRERESLGAAA